MVHIEYSSNQMSRLNIEGVPALVRQFLSALRALSGGLEHLFNTETTEHVTTFSRDQVSAGRLDLRRMYRVNQPWSSIYGMLLKLGGRLEVDSIFEVHDCPHFL